MLGGEKILSIGMMVIMKIRYLLRNINTNNNHARKKYYIIIISKKKILTISIKNNNNIEKK